ncbi:hypothetical protein DEU56DRAFT_749356 [Suillus clintonianus]|uniref:uncharacterized protein n=1 Tax=Suillus clintonianus TaxID=1904413 RepID=UPI001B8724D9|nr:uncharacterized protein DEU56DRAFT_749356 [Suillus clintonianus]KAG2112430.1 hypothetical protein DEU56DRAFT_749356 [Suillus clintonianus]
MSNPHNTPDEAATELSRLSLHGIHETAVIRPDGRVRIPRPPRKDTSITPSHHRPHVLASEHVLLWTTPHGLNFQNDLILRFPDSVVLKIFLVMIQSLDEDTRSNYGAGLLCFTQFCDQHRVPESECMPASSDLLVAFLANAAGTISSSAANTWMAGLHYWHSINGADWHGADSDVLRHIRRGLSKLTPPSSKCTKCPPVTLAALTQLARGLDLSNSLDIAVFATAAVAFWACCRYVSPSPPTPHLRSFHSLGELVIPGPNAFDSVKHVTRSILPIAVHESNNVRYTTLRIPWSKTTGIEGASISITGRNHLTCPLNALVHHLQSNLDIPSHAPLFSFETAMGPWSPLTKPWFLKCCNEVWVTVGHPSMPGHAFCIGGTTELLLEGIPPDMVAMQ